MTDAIAPDDSPHTITRADVRALRAAIDLLARNVGLEDDTVVAAERLAAKLAALLPPE